MNAVFVELDHLLNINNTVKNSNKEKYEIKSLEEALFLEEVEH
jgi:hypothetical protein